MSNHDQRTGAFTHNCEGCPTCGSRQTTMIVLEGKAYCSLCCPNEIAVSAERKFLRELREGDQIQFNGANQQQVFEFAGPIAMEHWPDHLTLVFPGENISVAPGEYLFKDREGNVVSGNPA